MSNAEPTIHLFEAAGLGKAPFKLLYVVSLPSPAMAAQNPTAYNNALRDIPRDVPCGTCHFCGTAIMNNFIIQSKDGRKHAVGCDCIAKVGDAGLVSAVKAEEKKKRKAKADAKREEKRQQWLADNADRITAERAQAAQRDTQIAQANAERLERLAPLVKALQGAYGNFAADMLNTLAGRAAIANMPGTAYAGRDLHTFTPRQLEVMQDIYARTCGNRNSAGYKAAAEQFTGWAAKPTV